MLKAAIQLHPNDFSSHCVQNIHVEGKIRNDVEFPQLCSVLRQCREFTLGEAYACLRFLDSTSWNLLALPFPIRTTDTDRSDDSPDAEFSHLLRVSTFYVGIKWRAKTYFAQNS